VPILPEQTPPGHVPGLRKLTVDLKWIVGLCGALVLLALSGVLLYFNTIRLIETSRWVAEGHAVATAQDELLARLTEAETGLFGFIITGEEAFLSPYLGATNRIHRLIVELRKATENDPRQQARLDALEPLIAKRLAFVEHRAEARRTEGLEAAIELVRRREAKTVMDALRDQIAEMKRAQKQLLEDRKQIAWKRARTTLGWVVGFGGLSVAILGLIFWRLLHENTRRRQSEASLEDERNALEQRVQERTACLARSNASLQLEIAERQQAERKLSETAHALVEKNKDLETLVYIASHDLRSPLVNIQGFSNELSNACSRLRQHFEAGNRELSPEDIHSLLKQDIPEAIQYIMAGVTRMDTLLGGFLRYSRLGRAALNIEPLNIAPMLRHIARTMEFQVSRAGATLEIDPVPSCLGDAVQVNQVFSNLLDNALKYLSPDRAGRIHVSGWLENGQAVYRVTDNGIGIAPEHHGKVFEIFQRLNPASGNGEGLGLAIAQRIIERLNGKIWVKSEPGRGSKFYVSLPAAKTTQEARKDEGFDI
jgi:signal transduction histidine kinase